jgi:predicted DCC family thiol-disulfide oxidoreductase YuxK
MKSSFLQRLRIDGASPPSYVEGMTRNDAAGPIIVFDAECILCSANAQFVLRHDRARRFRLASMQNAVGAALYRRFGIDPANPESMIIVDGDRLLKDSDAVLAIYAGLGWPWKALSLLRFIPRALRDPVYRWLARNRYRLFGRRDVCWIPAPEDADRVL